MTVYLLTLFLLSGKDWVPIDHPGFPPQEYFSLEECAMAEVYWNEYYAIPASEHIGPNRAFCIEKKS